MALALRDPEYHTYGDYLRWPEDVHYELIDGQAYLMAPAPTLDHQICVGEIFRQLANALGAVPMSPRPCLMLRIIGLPL